VVADQNVYYARAKDANGAVWYAATLAMSSNATYDLPSGRLSLLHIAGKPAVGFVSQAGFESPNRTIFFAQSTDSDGTTWSLPQSVDATTSSLPTPVFTMIARTGCGWIPISAPRRSTQINIASGGEDLQRGTRRKFPAYSRRRLRLVIGGRDLEAGAVRVRLHHGGPQGAKPKGEVVADILAGIKERRA
jgi:hypothetical protein